MSDSVARSNEPGDPDKEVALGEWHHRRFEPGQRTKLSRTRAPARE